MENTRRKNPDDFRFGKVIGEGSFSTVYLAKEIDSGKEFAIKVCEKDHIIREKKQQYVKREKSALHLLNNSPGIISLACTFQDPSKLYFVLTYAPQGEILRYINRLGSLNVECSRFYSAELLLAIEEMHKKKIIHRDLKPENLLLSRDMHLMIADFGSSKILPEDYDYEEAQAEIERMREERENESDSENERPASSQRRRASFVGTAQYVSPEILKGNAAHSATDLWSFGCILHQMLAGMPPFRGATEYLIFQKVLNGDFDFSADFDPAAKDLISQLLRFSPKDRLGSGEANTDGRYHAIRNHPFFEGVMWSELHRMSPPEMRLPRDLNAEEPTEEFNISDDIEPGLGSRQLLRIMQLEFGVNDGSDSVEPSASAALDQLLEEQRTTNEWATFVERTELILKYGFVNKRKKGLFARRRMLLLTNRPRLIYIDPNTNVKKGEIPFDATLKCEPRNFKMFFLHTPNRIYYLEDTTGEAQVWCEAIDEARKKYIKVS